MRPDWQIGISIYKLLLSKGKLNVAMIKECLEKDGLTITSQKVGQICKAHRSITQVGRCYDIKK